MTLPLDLDIMARSILHPSHDPERTMIELTLPTMTCGHCVKTVTRTVQQVDPAAQVEIDLDRHRVRIGSTLAPHAFEAALTEEGYAPQPAA
jgi:copper chaperone